MQATPGASSASTSVEVAAQPSDQGAGTLSKTSKSNILKELREGKHKDTRKALSTEQIRNRQARLAAHIPAAELEKLVDTFDRSVQKHFSKIADEIIDAMKEAKTEITSKVDAVQEGMLDVKKMLAGKVDGDPNLTPKEQLAAKRVAVRVLQNEVKELTEKIEPKTRSKASRVTEAAETEETEEAKQAKAQAAEAAKKAKDDAKKAKDDAKKAKDDAKKAKDDAKKAKASTEPKEKSKKSKKVKKSEDNEQVALAKAATHPGQTRLQLKPQKKKEALATQQEVVENTEGGSSASGRNVEPFITPTGDENLFAELFSSEDDAGTKEAAEAAKPTEAAKSDAEAAADPYKEAVEELTEAADKPEEAADEPQEAVVEETKELDAAKETKDANIGNEEMAWKAINDAMSTWPEDFQSWALAVFDCKDWPRSLKNEVYTEVRAYCRRYGVDGMGDKSAEMSSVMYWLQHLPEDSHVYGRLRLAAETAKASRT